MAQRPATLTPEQFDDFGRALDAIRERHLADLGDRDSDYIRNIIAMQRKLEIDGGCATGTELRDQPRLDAPCDGCLAENSDVKRQAASHADAPGRRRSYL